MELKLPKRERGGSGKVAAAILLASVALAPATVKAANKKPDCPAPRPNSPASVFARDIGCELAGLWQNNHRTIKKQPDPNHPGGVEILTSAQVGSTWRRAIAYMLETAASQPNPQTTYEVDSEVAVCKNHSTCGTIDKWWRQETIVYLGSGGGWQAVKYTGQFGHKGVRQTLAKNPDKVQSWAAGADKIVRSVAASARTELPKTIDAKSRAGQTNRTGVK